MIEKIFAAVAAIGVGLISVAMTIAVGLVLLFLLKILLLGVLIVAAFYLGRMAGIRMYWRFVGRPPAGPEQIIV